ncbi:MAG: DUF4857 domain-containing protein [Bacteroidales bacterium]|jgi:hypothetical protein|nr:DUF4857 domain-containing protein [Bacteroidales bacterium]
MKGKQIIYFILLLFVTVIGLWGIPELVKTAAYSRNQYPFVYFSSVEKKFLLREFDSSKSKFHDDEGKEFTEEQYDIALPLLNYRQLTVNGEMPDSIGDRAIDPRELRVKMVNFRYQPAETHSSGTDLYIMYESLPKKAKLESPGDVFRLNEQIQFIDDETNRINEPKSELFRDALLKKGFTFPAQWTYGNLNIRKAYDEGYFSLDAAGQLYHIKMVNGRPFVKNTKLDSSIEPAYFSMLEVSDKRFYGFLFDKRGNVFILEEGGGKYVPVQLEIDPISLDNDEFAIIGNMFYWTVSVQNQSGKKYYALDNETLHKQREIYLEASANKWDTVASYLFPAYLTFKSRKSDYISPRLHLTAYTALICNLILAILMVFLFPAESLREKIFAGIYALIFGIAGTLALLIIPNK